MSAIKYARTAFGFSALFTLVLGLLLVSACSNFEASKAEHISRGESFLKDKKFQEASIEFRNVIQLDDKSAPGHWGLARSFEGMRRFTEAFEELRRVTDLDANNLDARIKLGNYYLLIRPPQLDDADRMVSEVLQKSSDHIEGTILKGNILFLRGNAGDAFTALNHAIELDPKRVESYVSLARFFTSSKAPEKAEATFKRAIELNDHSAVAHNEYGKFLISVDRRDQAQIELEKAVQVEPSNRDARFVLASFYLVNRKLGQAEAAYTALADLDKDKPEGRSVLADYYSSVGRLREAIDIYREVVAKTPDYTRGSYRLGELMLQGGDTTGASALINQALQKNAHDMDALLLRARVQMQSVQQKDLRSAISDLTEVLRQEPSSRLALYYMADANFRIGQIAQARNFVGDLERFHPDYLAAKLMRTQIDLGAGDAKAAVQSADQLLQRLSKALPDGVTSPQMMADLQARTLSTRASAYLALGNLKSARADFVAARDAAPDSPSSYINIAMVYIREKKLDEATGFYDQALALSKTDFIALNGLIENVYVPKSRLDMAHQRVDAALQVARQSAPLHFLKASVYTHEGNATAAEAELRQALSIDPNYLAAYSSLGAMFARMKQPDRAIEEYQQLLKRDENATIYTLIGMLEEGRSNFDAAATHYRKALELDQNATVAANNLAWMFAVQGNGNLDEAVALAQGAVQRFPNTPGFLDTLGWVYQKKGLYGAAAEQFQIALSHDGGNVTYRLHLGLAFAGKGDKAGAKREIQEALKRPERLDPADVEVGRKALATLEG